MILSNRFKSGERVTTLFDFRSELSRLATFRVFLLALVALYLADTQGLDTFRDWQAACR